MRISFWMVFVVLGLAAAGCAAYAHDVDPGSEHDASWMFAEDGTFSSGGYPVVGRAALKEFYEGVRNRHSAGIRHVNASVVIMPTEEGARGDTSKQ